MGSTKVYDDVQLQHYRVTLDMSVLGDFDPRQVNYAKVFDLQENEEVEAYVESLDSYDPWWVLNWHIWDGDRTVHITNHYTMCDDIDTRQCASICSG